MESAVCVACSAVSQKCWQSVYRLEDTLLWIYHFPPHLSAMGCLELCSVVHQDNNTNNYYQVLPASSWCGLWPFFRQKAIKWETQFIWVHFLLLGAELPSFCLRLLLFRCLLVIFWLVFLSRAYSYLWEGGSGRRYYTIIRSRITIYFYKIYQEANKTKLMTTFMQSWVRIQVFIPSSLCPQNWELLFSSESWRVYRRLPPKEKKSSLTPPFPEGYPIKQCSVLCSIYHFMTFLGICLLLHHLSFLARIHTHEYKDVICLVLHFMPYNPKPLHKVSSH